MKKAPKSKTAGNFKSKRIQYINFIMNNDSTATALDNEFNIILHVVADHFQVNEKDILNFSINRFYSKIQAIIACLAEEMDICTMSRLATYFGRTQSSLTRTKTNILNDNKLNKELKTIKQKLKKLKKVPGTFFNPR